MKRLLIFDEKGFYCDEEIVQDGTVPIENQYLAAIDEEIVFYKPKLVDGQLVEGLTPEEIAERENQVPQVPKDPVYEKLEIIEQQMQADSLATFDVLANLYSEVEMGGVSQMEVMAVMYEELITLRAEVEAIKGGTV